MINLFIQKGFYYANSYCNIDLNKLLEITSSFRNEGFKYEWLFAKKMLRERDMYFFFKCYFTHCDFRLELEVYNLKRTILLTHGVVLQTTPFYEAFDHRFKKMQIEDDKIMLLDFLGHPSFEIDLNLLSQGVFNSKEIAPLGTELGEKAIIKELNEL